MSGGTWDPSACSWPPGGYLLQIYGGGPEELVDVNPPALAFDHASGLDCFLDLDVTGGDRITLIPAGPEQAGGVSTVAQTFGGTKTFQDGWVSLGPASAPLLPSVAFSCPLPGWDGLPAIQVDFLQQPSADTWSQWLSFGALEDTGAGIGGLLILSGNRPLGPGGGEPFPSPQSYAVTDNDGALRIGHYASFTDSAGTLWTFAGGLFESAVGGSGGGGGGGVAIGVSVTGGGPGAVLFVDLFGNLQQSSLFVFDGANLQVGGLWVNSVPYNWPAANTAGDLHNDGAGGLTWDPSGASLDDALALVSLGV